MAYGLPSRGQHDWDDELNNSMEYVRGQAETAKAQSDSAISTANAAYAKAQSVEEFVEAPTDTQIATKINEAGSATKTALTASTADSISGTPGSGLTPQQAVDYRTSPALSPMAYGAVGDNTADDKTALQAAVTAGASFGIPVDLRGKTYKTTDVIDLPAGTKLVNGTIHCTGAGKKMVTVSGDNVLIERVSLIGRHSVATTVSNEYGIYAHGASAASPLRNLRILNSSLELIGRDAINLKWVDGFVVDDCQIGYLGYTGIIATSCLNGFITGNDVDNVLAGISSNGYGITVDRNETDSLTTDPRAAKIVIAGNRVKNVPWNGIDTHGGEDITIDHNQVFNCLFGIQVGVSDNAANVGTFAPLRVAVTNNIIDGGVDDGSTQAGISFTGVPGATAGDASPEYATGTIVGNTIRRCGRQSDNVIGAISMRNTRGVAVVGNTFDRPSPYGICLYYDNRQVSIVGNTFMDVWSNSVPIAAAISVRSSNNTGTVAANTLFTTGAMSATYVNPYGVYSVSTTGTDLNVGLNAFTAAATPANGNGLAATFNSDIVGKSQILGKNGSATSPSFAFSAETNSGFYFVNTNQIGLTIAGTRKLRFLTTGISFDDGYNLVFGTATGTMLGTGATQKLSFYGATPIVRPSAYTQTYATTDKTLAAYTANAQSSAYTGSPADAASTAKLADLNALRVAYENLRAFTEDLAQQHNSMLDDLQALGLLG